VTGAYPVLRLGPVRSTRPWVRTYRGTPASVPEARRFVGELLAGCPARETLMTCVSELCANAIAHTASGRGGVFTVEVACPRDGVARIAVTDDGGPSVPAPGSLDLMAEGGRGLAMVAACTSRWGFSDAYPGRTVWAEASWPIAVASPDRPALGRPVPDRPVPDRPVSGRPVSGRPAPGRSSPRRARPVPPPDWPRGPAA
jgi:Histidine kinase-like ATPase domain